MQGVLAFAPFMKRHLDMAIDGHATSIPVAYVVHHDSPSRIFSSPIPSIKCRD